MRIIFLLNWCNLTEKGLLGKEVQDRAFGGDGPETTPHIKVGKDADEETTERI